MVARSGPQWQGQDGKGIDWKQELRQAFTRPDALRAFLGLPAQAPTGDAARGFRMLVPRGYADLMEPGNPDDPLLRQVLPLAAEDELHPEFSTDPVDDAGAALAPGVLQKYSGRALMVTTPACAIHCRYCFRRHFPYLEAALSPGRNTAAIAALGRDPTLTEVILSGGDPLMLDDEALATLIGALSAIPHLKRLRIHSRLPVVLPARVTPTLCRVLAETRLRLVVVIHANHARELGDAAGDALDRLRSLGAVLLNQSVLLRGVNDDPDALCELSEALFRRHVVPYYLHLLDRVQAAAHFEVPETEARRLISALRLRLPGYLVPRLVRDAVGTGTKVPIV
jgi:L-lysine 2,3-aminomutase